MDYYPGHFDGDGCTWRTQGHLMPYAAELRAEIGKFLDDSFASHLQGSYNFEGYAEEIIDKVVVWLSKGSPAAIENAHRSHVAYVRHLLTGGEANQKGYAIERYGPQRPSHYRSGHLERFTSRGLCGYPLGGSNPGTCEEPLDHDHYPNRTDHVSNGERRV